MSRRDDRTSLQQMLDHAHEAAELTREKDRDDLDHDRVLGLALARLLEVAGEAANRVSPDTRLQYPEIPWRQIIGLRNRLIHAYDAVDMDILWEILTKDLPTMIQHLERITR